MHTRIALGTKGKYLLDNNKISNTEQALTICRSEESRKTYNRAEMEHRKSDIRLTGLN